MKEKSPSIQIRLTLALSTATLIAALAAGIASFFAILEEAHEYQDDMLQQTAELVDARRPPPRIRNIDRDVRIDIQPVGVPNPHGRTVPTDLDDGFHDFRHKHTAHRAFIKTYPDGRRLAFIQETEFRDDAARASAWYAIVPMLLLVPVLGLITLFTIHRAFRPVRALSAQVAARDNADLSALPTTDIPREVHDFVLAINHLLDRIHHTLREQQRFIADAAHELRSPLTALSLQAERLSDAAMSADAAERLHTLREGIRRNRHLLEQLLAMARAQSPEHTQHRIQSLQTLLRRVIQEVHVHADAKHIDLGIDGEHDARVRADDISLYTLVRNLVDNAIRYTPPGGQIDLRILTTPQSVRLEIEDSGVGIPEAERARVFDPFYRSPGTASEGSGLGLAIAQTLVAQLGGHIELADSRFPSGLKVTVQLPKAEK